MASDLRVFAPAVVSIGWMLAACTAVIDVDSYVFGDAGANQSTPGLPLEPAEDAGGPPPARPPVIVTGPDDDGGEGEPPDAGSGVPPGGETPPTERPRPVVVDAPEPLLALAGNATGGMPRTATCPSGVIYGLVFQYWMSAAVEPDRLTYVWPLCTRLVPSPPSLSSGEEYDASWLVSDPADPVFAPLRENEGIDSLLCPSNQYLVGIDGSYDDPVAPSVGFRSLGIHCAGLASDGERSDVVHSAVSAASAGVAPAAGAFAFSQDCSDGRAASQLDLRFGNWLDAVGLGCSVVRWPFTAGHACAEGSQCQSGSCGGDGLCVP